MDTSAFRQKFRSEKIPRNYSGLFHLILNFSFLVFSTLLALSQVFELKVWEIMAIPVTLVLGNLVVFTLHRYPLHRPMPFFGFSYKIHTKWHHRFFTDEKLVFDLTRDFFIVFFPTWIVLGFVFLVLPGIYLLLSPIFSANYVFLTMAMGSFYFLSYEVVHFASHLPEDHFLIKIRFFKFMRDYHKIHHNPKLMRDCNFNIVFPFFDIIFNTYLSPRKQNASSNISS
ncbi:MAG: hypothetical protein DRQ88_08605 [Epsilonproteobacteria bacterium]|nr:MAG: hypothetical protein DRQ89_08120 [Campylobacterota bacterium]RLA65750.1 MAG: hypothetical protein DRQ88_08605 [Campylobacterota bacterium]